MAALIPDKSQFVLASLIFLIENQNATGFIKDHCCHLQADKSLLENAGKNALHSSKYKSDECAGKKEGRGYNTRNGEVVQLALSDQLSQFYTTKANWQLNLEVWLHEKRTGIRTWTLSVAACSERSSARSGASLSCAGDPRAESNPGTRQPRHDGPLGWKDDTIVGLAD